MAVGFICKWIVLKITYFLGRRFPNKFFNNLHTVKFFSKSSYLIPIITFFIFIRLTYVARSNLTIILSCITVILLLAVCAISLNAFVDACWMRIDERANKRRLPLKGIVQLAKGIIWIIAIVIALAVIFDKSPLTLLGGLGAFAAVLMLIFKDSILGVVASVQLSEYDTLHLGDWIVVPGTGANGTVEETNLISIKVRNFDKTTTMVPPYSLVSGSFTNYNTMESSGMRRISRVFYIDADTVGFADESLYSDLSVLLGMKEYIEKKITQRNEGRVENFNNKDGLVDGTIDTNLGLLRAYLHLYIDSSPDFAHGPESLTMIFSEQQTACGIPFKIYCFTSTSEWAAYEAIQSALFEHIAAILPKFRLSLFEGVSGRDQLLQAGIERGIAIDDMYGMPSTFYSNRNNNGDQKVPDAVKVD